MTDISNERRTDSTATRRAVLQAAGAGSAMGALATLFSTGAAATDTDPEPASGTDDLFDVDRVSEAAYPQSVASGGPTPSGAIAWTRVAGAAYEAGEAVGLQVTPAPDRSRRRPRPPGSRRWHPTASARRWRPTAGRPPR